MHAWGILILFTVYIASFYAYYMYMHTHTVYTDYTFKVNRTEQVPLWLLFADGFLLFACTSLRGHLYSIMHIIMN